MMARFVYYANAAEQTLAAPTSPDDVEGALHELAEGVGLAMGFTGMSEVSAGPLAGSARTITDIEIDALLEPVGVNADYLGASTTGFFSNDPSGFAAAVLASEQVIMDVYGLTEADIAAFREPAPE
jgi:hypothetical protein